MRQTAPYVRVALTACTLAALLACGCPFAGIPEALTPYDLVDDPDGDGSLDTARSVTWSGDSAWAAGGISVDPGNLLTIQAYLGGEIVGNNVPSPSEVDVFALGPLQAGDQISVGVTSLMQLIVNLTPLAQADIVKNAAGQALMLVDAQAQIVGYPAVAPIPIDADGEYFLVVESFVPGDYTFDIHRTHGAARPAPQRGVCLVQFGGGTGLDATFLGGQGKLVHVNDLPPFDLEQARPDLPGQADRFKETVRQFIEYIYADWDVLVTLDAAEAAAAGTYDMVLFTTPSAEDLGLEMEQMHTLGVEPTIDVEDESAQVGIIFIQAFEDARYLDFNSYAALWASVAAHEYGHAVGLWHVRQDSDTLMTPSVAGPEHARTIRLLGSADKEEARARAPIKLVQDPDRYLSRVLGRRATKSAQAIRERTRLLLPGDTE